MTTRNSVFIYLVLFAFLNWFFFSCTEMSLIAGNGVLMGKISIGPLCPVERIPPDPACLPTMETYKAWSTAVWTLDKKTKITTLLPKLDGTYQSGLPAGDYVIGFDVPHTTGVGGSNLPNIVSIANKDTTIFNINIDTGIR